MMLPYRAAVISPALRLDAKKSYTRLTGFLRASGVEIVLPVDASLGEYASLCADEIIGRGPGVHVLTACPQALIFLHKEFPSLVRSGLTTPSPMMLAGRRALAKAERSGLGSVLAVTLCHFKKSEAAQALVPIDIQTLADFEASVLDAGGIAWDGSHSDYDEPFPANGESSAIGQLVVAGLSARGIRARVVALDGIAQARAYLGSGDFSPLPGEYIVLELTFCAGGCAKPPMGE